MLILSSRNTQDGCRCHLLQSRKSSSAYQKQDTSGSGPHDVPKSQIITYDPADFAPEVHSPSSPEVVHDPQAFPPEVFTSTSPETIRFPVLGDPSNAPEALHDKKDSFPEVARIDGPEVKPEADATEEKVLAIEGELNERVRRNRRRWAVLIGVLVIIAAIGGSVGGILGRRSQ